MKVQHFFLNLILATGFLPLTAQWQVARQPWPESFGNHRAVISVDAPCQAAELRLEWRRHDRDVANRRFLIIDGETGDTVKNISRIAVSGEACHLKFGPVPRGGTYYFYYLPYEVQEGWGFYGGGYLKPEPEADAEWIDASGKSPAGIRKATVEAIECRTEFDSFYPMELIPTASEINRLMGSNPGPVLYFTEDRTNPVRMKDCVPMKWALSGTSDHFYGEAHRNEYYVFQIGVYAARQPVNGLDAGFSGCPVPVTCFNTEGIDPHGQPFRKKIDIEEGRVQPLWIGIDIPAGFDKGELTGRVHLKASGMPEKIISFKLKILPGVLADRGDGEPWRHSRLRWLNSTAGSEGDPVAPYLPVRQTEPLAFSLAQKQLKLDRSGLPSRLVCNGHEVLAGPVELRIGINGEFPAIRFVPESDSLTNGGYRQAASGSCGPLNVILESTVEYDGYLRYRATVEYPSGGPGGREIDLEDVRLGIPMHPDRSRYMMGMGLPGTATPASHSSGWKGPHDSFWIGDPVGGIWCELRGSSYHGPLLNLYRPDPPESWNNGGRGGFSVHRDTQRTLAEVWSGPRTLGRGERVLFEWAMLLTPVKPVDYAGQFLNRYYHSGAQPTPGPEDFNAGVKVINVHHANKFNPYINWPFIAVREMKSFVDSVHQLGRKVKIYYTVRELTNHVGELWALRSLGDEILGNGRGGGYPWLREHLVDGYTPQWYQHFPDGSPDASVLSAPGESRWLNYYIEGLSWLVRNVDIDGLYLDDVTYDRSILKRMRTVMARLKPDCLIDLHSNTGFSIGPATQYAEFFPFVDKLWFGESFRYDRMPAENWLVEVSGIPFGLMGDMLQGGGNRWLGMLFGMTVRLPWSTEGVLCDPKPVWKLWDEFRIHESAMVGFWDEKIPVLTDHPDVKTTVYIRPGRILVAIGNFSDTRRDIRLRINWKSIGLDPAAARIHAPGIENFQAAREFAESEAIPVEARQGWLIYIEQ